MVETTGRLLALLAALQSRPSWSGPELSRQLGVTVRTVRRDVERLRLLGYHVESETGAHGGYRLGPGGAAVPPLMLDADEVFALAALARATDRHGLGEAAERAIGKLEQALPASLQRDIALTSTVVRVASPTGDELDSLVLRTVSAALSRLRRAGGPLPRPQRHRQRAPPVALPRRQHRPSLVPRRPRRQEAGVAHVACRPRRVGRSDRTPVRGHRSARCGGARPALDQYGAVPLPGPRRARCTDRRDRRARAAERRRARSARRAHHPAHHRLRPTRLDRVPRRDARRGLPRRRAGRARANACTPRAAGCRAAERSSDHRLRRDFRETALRNLDANAYRRAPIDHVTGSRSTATWTSPTMHSLASWPSSNTSTRTKATSSSSTITIGTARNGPTDAGAR